jgi:hypothetical protein
VLNTHCLIMFKSAARGCLWCHIPVTPATQESEVGS